MSGLAVKNTLIEEVAAYLLTHSLGRPIKPEQLLKTRLTENELVAIAGNGQKVCHTQAEFEAGKKKIFEKRLALEKARQDLAIAATKKAAAQSSQPDPSPAKPSATRRTRKPKA